MYDLIIRGALVVDPMETVLAADQAPVLPLPLQPVFAMQR